VWPRDGGRPNRGGWHGGDEPQSGRAPFFLAEGDSRAPAAAAFTAVVIDAASGVHGGGRSHRLAREKKKQGREATQGVWFSPATLPMVAGVDGVASRRWRDVRWRHGRCGVR